MNLLITRLRAAWRAANFIANAHRMHGGEMRFRIEMMRPNGEWLRRDEVTLYYCGDTRKWSCK